MTKFPSVEHVYQNTFMDSTRWQHFMPRDGDILVCTSYKAGTTWTQMICALLIFQDPQPPAPIAELSPWFDLRLYADDDIRARYEAQTHRRFIKTHTPLDGLPYFSNAVYVVCGRDPRDIFLSMQQHKANQDGHVVRDILQGRGEEMAPPPDLPESTDGKFQLWMTRGSFDWEQDGYPNWSVFHHLETFWRFRHLPNIHFLHYADLQRDLEGEMRRLAQALGISVPETKWPTLVNAATFAEMKRNADRTAPDTDLKIWRDNAGFFHSGTSGKWKTSLSAESLALYDKVTLAREPQRMITWLEQGSGVAGDPKAA